MNLESLNILLVEGNPDDARLIRKLLKDDGNSHIQLTHVVRLDKGLQALDEDLYDLVLLNLSLPDSKGLDTLARAQTHAPGVPILVITDLDEHKIFAEEAMLLGAENYLVKENMKSDELGRTIRHAVVRKSAEEKLHIERDNLVNILDSMADGVYIVDQQFDIQYANPTLMNDFGSFEGRKCYEYFHEREDVCPWCKNQDVFAGKTVRWEWISEKNQRTYDLIDTPLRNPDGSLSKLEIFRDVTEKKHAEEELKKSEARFGAVVESATDAVIVIDSEGNIQFLNTAAGDIFGYSEDEITGKPAEFLMPESFRDAHRKGMARLASTGEPKIIGDVVELIGLKNDGSEFPIALALSTWEAAEKTYYTAIIRDITMRKQAETTLREERDRAQKYLDVAGTAFIVIDADEKVSLINKAGCEMLCGEEDEIVGQNWFDNFIPERKRSDIRAVFRLVMTEEMESIEYYENPLITKDGNERIIAWHNTALTDETGKILGTLSSGEDITDRLQAEKTLKKYAGQLETLNAITEALSTSLELDLVLELILKQIKKVLPYDSGTIFLHEEDELRVVADRGNEPSVNGHAFPSTTIPIQFGYYGVVLIINSLSVLYIGSQASLRKSSRQTS